MSTGKMNDVRVIESSGNVFADLGLPDSDLLLRKSDIVIGLRIVIEDRGLEASHVPIISNPKRCYRQE